MADSTGTGNTANNTPSHQQGGSEGRRANRKKGVGFHFLLTLDEDLQPIDARSVALMDISASGCGLYQVDEAELGERVGVVLMKQGVWEEHLGVIRHCRAEQNGWMRVGIEYEPMPEGVEHRFTKYSAQAFGFNTGARRSA